MKLVLYDQDWAKTAPNLELYYMHRGVRTKDNLRYDITIIPAMMLGTEFIKTKGHRHQKYQELYTILEGKAIFLLQKINNNKIEDVYMVKARKNEIVIIPSLYDHITINPLKKELKLANWISSKCKSDYKFIEKKKGACYFYTKKGWIKNKNYKNIPKLRSEKPLKSIPKNLDFLN
ncbi:hypothetical protein KAS79_02495 [Candidatus Parcubacteria bacterium]|nr:hypothetical protein [Candidatus Parcubacteria bacterium]